ncbi:DUF2326 domain-containing protein [Neorhodopirellula lusitana]|uniref:DUF2326 domain-containing protein n=1 Tax=Neorhodopirellula lusitana TaxID=445327 RepID=UPI003851498E
MRLIELTSNRSSFKPVRFNESGLSLIVGRHSNPNSRDSTSTYNGVGKSLIVTLIHFCMGGKRNPQIEEHLVDWQFNLVFTHDNARYEVTRTVGETRVSLNGEDMPLAEYKRRLSAMAIFQLPEIEVPFLTFKSLLSFFVRPRRSSYVSYAFPESKWKDYQSVLCQSYLLGLDYQLAVQKHDLKKNLDEQLTQAEKYRKDSDLRQYYVGDRNAEVELAEIEREIGELENRLSEFEVASDYTDRKQRADQLHESQLSLSNEIVASQNLIADIELALEVRSDISSEQLLALYEEARLSFPGAVVKRLNDVEDFYRKLGDNRRQRLLTEQREIEASLTNLESRLKETESQLDAELQYLNAHSALDEYTENNRYLSELHAKKAKIQDYIRLLDLYTEQAQETRLEMGQANLRTSRYLKNTKAELDKLMSVFRKFAQALYGVVPSGLTVSNNDGENKVRFDIDAHIPYDQADGINQGKIFCFDLLLLILQQRHSMQFVFHDNRLFADMDPHQRLSLFKLANEVCEEFGFQYIASLNDDVIESVQPQAGDEFEKLFVEPVVLELTDARNGTGKLLGIQVDMRYESET